MAEQDLFGKTYHIDDLDCADHGEAARYVAERVLNAKKEFGRGYPPESWSKLAVCSSGRHNIIAQMAKKEVKSFVAETRKHPFKPAGSFYRV